MSDVFRSDHCRAVIFPLNNSFGILYEFGSSNGGDNFFLYLSTNEAIILHEPLPKFARLYERRVTYRNSGKDYANWFSGRLHASMIEWEGSGSAHVLFNSLLQTWRTNFISRAEFHSYADKAISELRRGERSFASPFINSDSNSSEDSQ